MKKPSPDRRRIIAGTSIRLKAFAERVWLPLLIAAAFLVRLWGMSKMHYWDENVYLLNAEYIFPGKAGYTELGSRPPLLSILFAGAFHLWHSDYAAEIVTALINALAAPFLYLAGRRVVGARASTIAALLLAFGPCLAGVCPDGQGSFIASCNGHSLYTDCPAVTLIILSFWLLTRALEHESDLRFALTGLSLALAVLMRFGSLSCGGILFLLVFAAKKPARAAITCAAGFAIGIAPYLVWSRMHYGGFFTTLMHGWHNLTGPSEPFLYYVRDLPATFTWLTMIGLVLWGVRRILQASTSSPHPDSDAVGKAGWLRWDSFLLLWLVIILLFFSTLKHKEPRYDLPATPPLLLLAGAGLSWLIENKAPRARTAGTVLVACAMTIALWPIHHRFDSGFIDPSASEEMIVSGYLKSTLPPSTILCTNQNYPDFAWYTGMTVEALPAAGPRLYDALQHFPADGVLIAYKVNDNGENVPVEPRLSLLDADPRFSRLHDFPTLVVYQYKPAPSSPN